MKLLTPIKAIRAKCLDCCCNQRKEVRLCPIPDCSLYPYRFGKKLNHKGIGHPLRISRVQMLINLSGKKRKK